MPYLLTVLMLALVWSAFIVVHPVTRNHLESGAVYPAHASAAHLVWAAALAALAFTVVACWLRRAMITAGKPGLLWLSLAGLALGYVFVTAAFSVACLVERDGAEAIVRPGSWLFGGGVALMGIPILGTVVWFPAIVLATGSAWLLHRAARRQLGAQHRGRVAA